MTRGSHKPRAFISTITAPSFVAIGAIAPLLPVASPCIKFSWLLCFVLLATGALALAPRARLSQFLLGAIAAMVAVIAACSSFSFAQDQPMSFRSILANGILGALFSFAPVYHVLRVQKKVSRAYATDCRRQILGGAYVGIIQAAFALLFVVPALWWLLPENSKIEYSLQHGPVEIGGFVCVAFISGSIVIAGTIAGALAAFSMHREHQEHG